MMYIVWTCHTIVTHLPCHICTVRLKMNVRQDHPLAKRRSLQNVSYKIRHSQDTVTPSRAIDESHSLIYSSSPLFYAGQCLSLST